jgi:hypothetical protein
MSFGKFLFGQLNKRNAGESVLAGAAPDCAKAIHSRPRQILRAIE